MVILEGPLWKSKILYWILLLIWSHQAQAWYYFIENYQNVGLFATCVALLLAIKYTESHSSLTFLGTGQFIHKCSINKGVASLCFIIDVQNRSHPKRAIYKRLQDFYLPSIVCSISGSFFCLYYSMGGFLMVFLVCKPK